MPKRRASGATWVTEHGPLERGAMRDTTRRQPSCGPTSEIMCKRHGHGRQPASTPRPPRSGNWLGVMHGAAESWEAAGDYPRAATIWARIGKHLSAAAAWQKGGEPGRAAAHYEEAHDYARAGPLWASLGQHESAAHAFERAGDLTRAAAQWEEAGEVVVAARTWGEAGVPLECRTSVGSGG
jgi:hypothetical protein